MLLGNLEIERKETSKMDNEEIMDSGIIGYTIYDEIQEELDETKTTLKDTKEDLDETKSDLESANWEIGDLEGRLRGQDEEEYLEEIKLRTMSTLHKHLERDNLMTPELEEWLENFHRFYLKEA